MMETLFSISSRILPRIDAIALPVGDHRSAVSRQTIGQYRCDPLCRDAGCPVIVSLHDSAAGEGDTVAATTDRGPMLVLTPRSVRRVLQGEVFPGCSSSSEDQDLILDSLDLLTDDEREPTPESSRSGAFTFSGGANRNRLLLATAGSTVVMSDDDEPPLVATAPTYREGCGLRLSAEGDPNLVRPFRSSMDLDDAYDWEICSVEELHGAYLGRSVDPRRSGEEALSIDQIGPNTEALVGTISDRAPIVRITTAGYAGAGSAGMYQRLLSIDGDERERFVADRTRFLTLLYSGVWSTFPDQIILADDRFFRTGHAGYDNRIPLPPFPPIGRGEDVAWGAFSWFVLPPGSKIHVPIAIRHRKTPHVGSSKADLVLPGPRLNDLLFSLVPGISDRVASSSDIPEAMQRLGARLVNVAAQAAHSPTDFVDSYLTALLHKRIRDYEGLLERFDRSPPWWSEMMGYVIEVDRFRLKHREERRLVDVPQEHPELAVEQIGRNGRLLALWPDIHRVCGDIPLSDWAG